MLRWYNGLVHCCVAALLRWCVGALLRCCVVALLRCRVPELLRCWGSAGVLEFWGVRVFKFSGGLGDGLLAYYMHAWSKVWHLPLNFALDLQSTPGSPPHRGPTLAPQHYSFLREHAYATTALPVMEPSEAPLMGAEATGQPIAIVAPEAMARDGEGDGAAAANPF